MVRETDRGQTSTEHRPVVKETCLCVCVCVYFVIIQVIMTFTVHLASKQPVKVRAIKYVIYGDRMNVTSSVDVCPERLPEEFRDLVAFTTHVVDSGVSPQPIGRDEIRRGAMNRLSAIKMCPAIAIESGAIIRSDEVVEVACVLMRTRFGVMEHWTDAHVFPWAEHWMSLPNRSDTTLGDVAARVTGISLAAHDWQQVATLKGYPCPKSRTVALKNAFLPLWREFTSRVRYMSHLQAPVVPFNGVEKFIDIQGPLMTQPRLLMGCVQMLAQGVMFNKVGLLSARGLLFAGEFARRGFSVVMLRKKGKLPRVEQDRAVTYQREYGEPQDLEVTAGAFEPGDRVLLVDDLVATGGTFLAATRLVVSAGGQVASYIAPFAIDACMPGWPDALRDRVRFARTLSEVEGAVRIPPPCAVTRMHEFKDNDPRKGAMLISPSMTRSLMTVHALPLKHVIVRTSSFWRTSRLEFPSDELRHQNVFIVADSADVAQIYQWMSLASILHRHDVASITWVLPFLEQATQDRVEYDGHGMQTLASVDTVLKLVDSIHASQKIRHRVVTFDLHAPQSQFVGHDVRDVSLVRPLWDTFQKDHPGAVPVFPDAGAAKRFGFPQAVVFNKVRRGKERILTISEGEDLVREGRVFCVVDDLVRSGGTMRQVHAHLTEKGVRDVYCLFAHAAFEPAAVKNLAVFDDRVWTTDTVPECVPDRWVRLRFMDALFEKVLA